MARWIRRPDRSNWGEFGPDDQLGRLNLITPKQRRAAIAEASEGIAFALSLPLDVPKGAYSAGPRKPPQLKSTPLGHNHQFTAAADDVVSDDYAVLHLQYSTQWDSFAHHGAIFDLDGTGEAVVSYYNGYRGGTDIVGDKSGSMAPYAHALGIENFARSGVQGRGVMVDLRRALGDDRVGVDLDLLTEVMDAQNVSVETGDILCLHTGLTRIMLDAGDDLTAQTIDGSCAYLDATDDRLLQWITDSGISAIAADNLAIERFSLNPANGGRTALPLHDLCLFRQGIPLGEMWYFEELSAWLTKHERSRFLLTAPPLNLPGAVGSPVTAVATV